MTFISKNEAVRRYKQGQSPQAVLDGILRKQKDHDNQRIAEAIKRYQPGEKIVLNGLSFKRAEMEELSCELQKLGWNVEYEFKKYSRWRLMIW